MRKVALCVGLNYPDTDNELYGCVNDALDWQSTLTSLGYTTNILLEPNKAELVSALLTGLDGLRFADRFVFTYSGHGSWVPDQRGGDELDGRDEVLCPSDLNQGQYLTDDELFIIFQTAAAGVRRYIFSDSCHSGTISRFQRIPLTSGALIRPKFISPDQFLSGPQLQKAREVETMPVRAVSRPGAVLFSGCADTEFSYDAWFDGRPNGAFTRTALKALNGFHLPSLRLWHARIRQTLPSYNYPQSPQLGAASHQRYWTL